MKYTFNSDEENHFKTISNFKECIIRGGEPVFIWKGLQYGVCFYGEDRLRDVITQVTVLHRNI